MKALRLHTEALPVVRIGVVGLGERGLQAVRRLCHVEGVRLTALCDLHIHADNIQAAIGVGTPYYGVPTAQHPHQSPAPRMFADYRHVCRDDGVDLVYICTDWLSHTPIILEALEHGKHVAVEVPAATTLTNIRAIVDAAEQSQRHCMMLENCVYDFFEMAVRNMVEQGLLGKVVHVEGGYAHPLGDKWPSWRLAYNHSTRGDVYPTHGMGPACQILGIHRTDRLESLVSIDTAPFLGKEVARKHGDNDPGNFQNGDQTTTLIRTMKGKTILLQHNVMTPRPYSRMFQVVGTKGFAEKYPHPYVQIGVETPYYDISSFLPSYITPLMEKGKMLDSRGGMAYFMDSRLIHCLRHGLPLDMDVYDLAEWCAVAELSRQSIEQGFKTVDFPQFC